MQQIQMSELDPASTVVVATGNPHKVTEIEAILGPRMPGVRFVAIGQLGDFPDPEEDGDTFEANALIKARAALDETGFAAVADDSGLVVDALGGEPGVYSARWAGAHGDDKANNDKLIRKMVDVPDEKRTAHFHSTVVLVRADGTVLVGNGRCEGSIGHEPRGTNGFGYDPLFWPNDTPGKTMAELTPDEKNRISHRFHALEDLAAQL
ncbi:MAG: RdgB/HAM1 family non-canonical purine NTP pyrophosphatase [Tractidigestivibacter sp.]|jgi:XTP/dITP diphosphohydrolase|uniref:RdgB/HAM1 family non-canonical purine NTP pyrophosphatase n=1 Tax=Tractidigestivibacter sp. TaxID=2847320 RepID=UPI003D9013AF